jgi:DNA-binding CsgD family transcriptional regulator/PAS domain-containing protein
MQNAALILPLVERLYAAVGRPEAWGPALASVVALLRAGHAVLHLEGANGAAPGFAACAGLDARDQARFVSPEAARLSAPWAGKAPVGTAFSNLSLWSEPEFERSDFYNEVVRPAGGYFGAGAIRPLPSGAMMLAVCRPRDAGDFGAEDLAMVQTVSLHLAAAVDLHLRLGASEKRYASLTGLLDKLDDGVVLLDARGSVVFVNAPASRILSDKDGLILTSSGLTPAIADTGRRLREAIASATTDVATGNVAICVERPSRRLPLLLTVVPIRRLGAEINGALSPCVAVFIAHTDAPMAIDRTTLADTFRLTRRESEVAALLATGHSTAAIAAMLGVSTPTVRQYIKHAFDKTGTHSQNALTALVRRFMPPPR